MGTKHNRRDYSSAEKAAALAALAANGGNYAGTARQLEMPEATLRKWHKNGIGVNAQVQAEIPMQRRVLADAIEQIAWRLVDHVLVAETIAGMNGQQAMVALGIAIDKMRLLRDLPTEIVQLLPVLMSKAQARGHDPTELFNALIASLDEEHTHG
jgi:hypothetical protein